MLVYLLTTSFACFVTSVFVCVWCVCVVCVCTSSLNQSEQPVREITTGFTTDSTCSFGQKAADSCLTSADDAEHVAKTIPTDTQRQPGLVCNSLYCVLTFAVHQQIFAAPVILIVIHENKMAKDFPMQISQRVQVVHTDSPCRQTESCFMHHCTIDNWPWTFLPVKLCYLFGKRRTFDLSRPLTRFWNNVTVLLSN